MSTELDFVGTNAWVRGEDVEFTFTVFDSANSPEDLTDALVELEIKKADADPDPALVHLDSTAGLVIRDQVDPNIGIGDGVLSHAQTSSLISGKYRYDIFVTLPGSGFRKRSQHGVLQMVDTPNQP